MSSAWKCLFNYKNVLQFLTRGIIVYIFSYSRRSVCDIVKTGTFACFVTWSCINNFVVLLAHMSEAKNVKNSKIQLCYS